MESGTIESRKTYKSKHSGQDCMGTESVKFITIELNHKESIGGLN